MVAGEAAQTAALLRSGQVDALSQFDTQYALTENAGAKLRPLDEANKAIAHFPSNGFVALEDTLKTKREESVGAGPRLRHGHGVRDRQSGGGDPHPLGGLSADQGHRQGRGDRAARRPQVLKARAANWPPSRRREEWGENSRSNYNDYVDFLVKTA